MREILFKAKSKDNGEWTEGYYAMLGDEDLARHFIVQNCAVLKLSENSEDNMFFNDVEIDPETLCQYTGLKDKNGDRIWENDIFYHQCLGTFGRVVWSENDEYIGWAAIDKYDGLQCYTKEMFEEVEVIGNIFDNPEQIRQTDI